MNTELTGFVLAGGRSSRMGTDKAMLTIDGETFLSRAVKVLTPVCAEVRIVLNQTQTLDTEHGTVRDLYASRGVPGAIHGALAACETKFALILAVDLPLVTTGALEQLARFAVGAEQTAAAIIPRQTDGRAQPLCAVYRVRDCLPPLDKLLTENSSASMRDFLDLIAPRYVEASRLSENENLLFNVNYPADYRKIN